MKRLLGIAVVLSLVGTLSVMAQEVKPAKVEVIDLGKYMKLEMVLVPAGKFMMGSPASEKNRSSGEKQHEVTLTKPFYMGKHEVTQEQWEAVMADNPSDTKAAKLPRGRLRLLALWRSRRDNPSDTYNPSDTKGAKLPVTEVSWDDCQEFIKKLNKKTDGGYRLPTESEWEYACRAETTTAYSFGDKITPMDANYRDSEIGKLVPVGSYKPNAFGLYDMHGNVWEWCEDWHGDYPAGAVTDPKGLATGDRRVLRSGSFVGDVSIPRSSNRAADTPTYRYYNVGFRLVRDK